MRPVRSPSWHLNLGADPCLSRGCGLGLREERRVTVRVAWVLSGDRSQASSRLQGFLIHESLQQQGMDTEIVASGFSACPGLRSKRFFGVAARVLGGRFTHLIVEAPEWPAVQLAVLARKAGLAVLAVRCDRYPADYDRYFECTILPTQALRAELKVQKAAVIPDMIEVPELRFKGDYGARGRPLRVVWVGHRSYSTYILGLIAELKGLLGEGFEFITVSSGPEFSRQWGELSVVEDILDADIALIPVPDGDWFKGKSSNRLAMMFSLGMPTVATPLSAYLDLGRHDENLLFARTPREFAEQLLRMRDPSLRERLGRAARASLDGTLTRGQVAARWGSAIAATQAQPGARTAVGWLLRGLARLVQKNSRRV